MTLLKKKKISVMWGCVFQSGGFFFLLCFKSSLLLCLSYTIKCRLKQLLEPQDSIPNALVLSLVKYYLFLLHSNLPFFLSFFSNNVFFVSFFAVLFENWNLQIWGFMQIQPSKECRWIRDPRSSQYLWLPCSSG